MRVLVVEDEQLLADAIAGGLRRHAMAVDVAYDGDAALERLAVNDYDVVVLDRDLPIVSGDEVCAMLAESGVGTRILMLTAATAVSQRVAGLSLGADDYRPDPGAGPASPARRAPGAGTGRHPPGPASPHGGPRRPASRLVPQGVRGPRRAAASRRRRGLGRASAGEGMGRTRRSVHRRRPVHHHDAAPEAGRPAGHRDRSRCRVPHPMTTPRRWWRSTIRVRLTLLYAAAFFLAGAVLVAVMYFYLGAALDRQLTARAGITEHLPTSATTEPGSQQAAHQAQKALRAQFQRDRDDTLNTMLVASLVALGAVGVIAAGFGWLLAGRALHPLQQITATARRVAGRSLHERIALDGPHDEIKDLADTFDAMLERLDRSFDSQRRFVANASHELRTPLTINRTLIEVAPDNPQANESLRQLGATLLAVNQRHERLIDGLLTLASSEERLSTHSPVDLADILRRIATESQAAAQQSGVEIRTALASAPVAGDPALLERLVQNLIDNAIRYNQAEHGWVAVTSGLDDATAQLTVENPGPPVPTYEIPSLFEPFRRLATTERRAAVSGNHGAGLGLSIVRAVAHAHGGDVHAVPRRDGGLTIHVRIPALATDNRIKSPDRNPTRTSAASEPVSAEGATQPE